jgi:hypothetical protein
VNYIHIKVELSIVNAFTTDSLMLIAAMTIFHAAAFSRRNRNLCVVANFDFIPQTGEQPCAEKIRFMFGLP